MSKEMLEAFRILEEDKGIKKEDIIEAVTESLRSAYRRRYGQSESAAIEFNEKTGDFRVYTVREVVDEVFDSRLEISLKDALAISSAYELGDKIKFEEAPAEFGRVAAQSAKQTIMEKMRKQTRTITYNTYKEHENEIMSGTVERFDNRFIYVNLGSIEAQLSKQDQIPGEVFQSHDRIEVFVYKVEDNPRGVNVFVSRSHPEMIKRLMEQEIPEVYDGTVEIMSVAREAGDRTKVAVRSHNPNVDAIGTIVGRGGSNIKKITSKFHPARYDQKLDRMVPTEENIDVIEWVPDPAEFIYNAIAPAEVDQVIFDDEDSKHALVVVPGLQCVSTVAYETCFLCPLARNSAVRISSLYGCLMYRIECRECHQIVKIRARADKLDHECVIIRCLNCQCTVIVAGDYIEQISIVCCCLLIDDTIPAVYEVRCL